MLLLAGAALPGPGSPDSPAVGGDPQHGSGAAGSGGRLPHWLHPPALRLRGGKRSGMYPARQSKR